MQQSFRNVYAKFKVDPSSRFCTGARQVFTIQKPFPSEIPLAIKRHLQSKETRKMNHYREIFFTEVIGNRVKAHYARNIYVEVFLKIAVLLVTSKVLW